VLSNIEKVLMGNDYPGRGIIIGHSDDGNCAVIVYFIMGRSENSRNRIFEKTSDGIQTAAFIPELLTDPSLVIYSPVRTINGHIVVTNGSQTDTIYKYLENGESLTNALNEWSFEPDPPIYTPRISGVVNPDGTYLLSILRTKNGDPSECERCVFEYASPTPGIGHFISTYNNDGNPPPSFKGEPKAVEISSYDNIENFAKMIWNSLNSENKVSLYTLEHNFITGKTNSIIINKHEEGTKICKN